LHTLADFGNRGAEAELTVGGLTFDAPGLAAAVAERRVREMGDIPGARLIAAPSGSAALTIELLAALADGATLVVPSDAERDDPAALVELIRSHRATLVVAAPDILARIVHTGVSVLPSVRHWDVLGTHWPVALPSLLPALAGASVADFAYRVAGYAGAVARGPLGSDGRARPVPGARVSILDERLRPVPTGVTGEVYVTGAGLAVRSDTAPAHRFVTDPSSGDRWYRTGDRARWSRDGRIIFAPDPVTLLARTDRPAVTRTGTETELRLIALLEELLQITDICSDDNFFALGGDSVVSIQWSARANEIGLPLSPQLVFEHLTIAELAIAVDEAELAADEPADPTGVAPPDHPPMSLSGLSEDALAALGAAWKQAR
jgi:mycobactin peptide synthetase MbtE